MLTTVSASDEVIPWVPRLPSRISFLLELEDRKKFGQSGGRPDTVGVESP